MELEIKKKWYHLIKNEIQNSAKEKKFNSVLITMALYSNLNKKAPKNPFCLITQVE